MAANYWTSTQRRCWLFSRETLSDIRERLEGGEQNFIHQYPLPDLRLLSLYFNLQITKLGKRLPIRQQALATAQVYLRRFYVKVSVRHTNPYMMMATALYLACKMEECPQHIRIVLVEARAIWSEFMFPDVSKLGEFEFYLISELNSQLIVHHPYRTLDELKATLNMDQDDVSLAWSIINDHYLTDLPLLYPPHVIAVTAIFLAITLKPTQAGLQAAANTAAVLANTPQLLKDTAGAGTADPSIAPNKIQNLVSWLAEGEIDIKAVIECTQEIISLYEVWEQFNEKVCKEQIARYIKARGLDK